MDRRFKQENGPQADFPNCVAFGKTAEFIEKYFSRGMKIELCGRIQTGSYAKEDGTKVYATDVVAESVGFAESKTASPGNTGAQSQSGGFGPADANGSMDIPDGAIDEELQFNQ